MPDNFTIRVTDIHDNNYQQIYDLREKVLREPIGLSLKNEDLSGDVLDMILIAEKGDAVIACLMLHPSDVQGAIKLRQMAVYDEWQGQGIGKMLVIAAEETALKKGIKKIILHARTTALNFYAKLGYVQISDVFTEVGIPHVIMEKELF